eukprot:5449520-Amphidinium_carterae.1
MSLMLYLLSKSWPAMKCTFCGHVSALPQFDLFAKEYLELHSLAIHFSAHSRHSHLNDTHSDYPSSYVHLHPVTGQLSQGLIELHL